MIIIYFFTSRARVIYQIKCTCNIYESKEGWGWKNMRNDQVWIQGGWEGVTVLCPCQNHFDIQTNDKI